MVGATQKVDMHHLRRTGEVRILVAVLDVKDIPKKADICVNRSIFRVYFKVDEVVLDDSFNPEDDDLLGDDAGNGINDDIHNDADGSGDHQMEMQQMVLFQRLQAHMTNTQVNLPKI